MERIKRRHRWPPTLSMESIRPQFNQNHPTIPLKALLGKTYCFSLEENLVQHEVDFFEAVSNVT